MTLKTALATAALLLACGPALAQSAAAPTATQPETGAMTTQQVKTATVQFITLAPAAAVTSRLLGTKVTNAQNGSRLCENAVLVAG